ncbi:MAG: hypothetical protein J1F40_05485 [Prevotellaceae bacterium]|nr:hypothetical protein [Prevotellaceae bacterium]
MSKKDNRILSQQGGRYPFHVSEEYFDNLTARIMAQIPEDDAAATNANVVSINRKRHTYRWISIVSVAASLVLIVAVTLKFIPLATSNSDMDEFAEYVEDDYNEDLMTYTMADGMAVYGYLSGENME